MGAGWLAVEIGFIFTKIHSELQINTLGRERESRPSFVGGTQDLWKPRGNNVTLKL